MHLRNPAVLLFLLVALFSGMAMADAPPFADANGVFAGRAGTAVTISGSASDDVGVSDLTWAFVPSQSFTPPGLPTGTCAISGVTKLGLGTASASSTAQVTCLPEGDYAFTLTAKDTANQLGTSTTQVHVKDGGPLVNSGNAFSGRAGTAVSLAGSATDDHALLDLSWSQESVPPFSGKGTCTFSSSKSGLGTPSASIAGTVTCPKAGNYVLVLTALDSFGQTAKAPVLFQSIDNPATVQLGGPYAGLVSGPAISISGSATDDYAIASFTWKACTDFTCSANAPCTFSTSSSGLGTPSAFTSGTVSCSLAGAYALRLSATDTLGQVSTWATVLQVSTSAPAGSAPVVTCSAPFSAVFGNKPSFSCSATAGAYPVQGGAVQVSAPPAAANPCFFDTGGVNTYYSPVSIFGVLHACGELSTGASGDYALAAYAEDSSGLMGYAAQKVTFTDGPPPVYFDAPHDAAGHLDTHVNSPFVNALGVDVWDDVGESEAYWSMVSGPGNCFLTAPYSFLGNVGPSLGMDNVPAYSTVTCDQKGTYVFKVTGIDTSGQMTTKTNQFNVLDAPPTVNLPMSLAFPAPLQATLQGSADDDVYLKALAWTMDSGPAGATCAFAPRYDGIGTAHATTVSGVATCTKPGNYLFCLTATDSIDQTGRGCVAVNGMPAPPGWPLTVDAGGPYSGKKTVQIPIQGTATSMSGDHVNSLVWSFVSGPGSCTFSPTPSYAGMGTSSTTITSWVSCTTLGNGYVIKLTARDDAGNQASDTATVNIVDVPPVVNWDQAAYSGTHGATVPLSGTGTDSDGFITSFWGTVESGPAGCSYGTPTETGVGGPSHTATHANTISCPYSGTYTLRLHGTDDAFLQSYGDATLTINNVGIPPVITASGGTRPLGTPVPIAARATDSDGTLAQLTWSGPGACTLTTTATGLGTNDAHNDGTASCTPAGTYTLQVTAIDNDGDSATKAVTVKATAPPTAQITSPAPASAYAVGVSFPLAGQVSDADGQVASVLWTWAQTSGPTGTCFPTIAPWTAAPSGTTAGTLYCNNQGTYQVTLTATDNDGQVSAPSTVSFTLTPGGPVDQPPTVRIVDPSDPYVGIARVAFPIKGTAVDSDGKINRFVWSYTVDTAPAGASCTINDDPVTLPADSVTGTGTMSCTEPGDYILHLQARDNGGNVVTADRAFSLVAPGAPGAGSGTSAYALSLNCPRLTYANETDVEIQCLKAGTACTKDEVTAITGASATFKGQQGNALTYTLSTFLVKDYAITASTSWKTVSCSIRRVGPVAATTPDVNVLLLPLLGFAALALLRRKN